MPLKALYYISDSNIVRMIQSTHVRFQISSLPEQLYLNLKSSYLHIKFLSLDTDIE